MQIQKIGFMSPGDMGQAVAIQLLQKFTVCTALDKRSERSRVMAKEAGLTDVGSIARMVAECDLIMSVMNPGAGLDFAKEIAAALSAKRKALTFVECNAIAPVTMHAITDLIVSAGGRCLDGGIIGPPPRGKAKTNLYVSGPGAGDLEQLHTEQLRVHVLSERIGDASALKMCYGAINKGTQALILEALVAARSLGVDAELEKQLLDSRSDMYNWIIGTLPTMPPKAYRWVPEMLQISKTFESAGMTPRIFQGAADMFEFIAVTPIGRETPENRDKSRGGKDVVRLLAEDRSAAIK